MVSTTCSAFGPPKRPDDPGFGEAAGENRLGAVFFPCAGYIGDPQLATHNVQRAAEAKGAAFRFNAEVAEIRRENGRVAGITLAEASGSMRRVVVNVAGPHSSKINRMAGVEDGMTIKTRALKQEVAHVPFPAGFDFERMGLVTSDSRHRLLLPAGDRQPPPDRQRGSAVRRARVGRPG